jgi:predicted acetyltransferase
MTAFPLVTVDPSSELLPEWLAVVRLVLKNHEPLLPEWVERRRTLYVGQRVTAAMDGGRVVGTYRSWDVDLTVPGGGTVRADAISSVMVKPTHRRRGVLSTMIDADLAGAAERGVPVAVLVASEGGIYGRFGFGTATETVTWTVDTATARFHAAADALAGSVDVDIVTDAELREVALDVYARSRRPGDIDRPDLFWDLTFGTSTGDLGNAAPGVAVVARDASGTPQGILRYTVEEKWAGRLPRSVAEVGLLHAATPGANAALWRFLINLDLVATVRAADRSLEEPLPWLLRDARAAQQSGRVDFLWTRVVDPAAVLAGRRYEAAGAVVLEIADPRGWAAGRFALEVSGDGAATCAPTAAPADVELPVGTLGAVWLGGVDLAAAAAAGLAVEHRPGALGRAARLLRTATPPWSSTWF